jgi:hypothetical protein
MSERGGLLADASLATRCRPDNTQATASQGRQPDTLAANNAMHLALRGDAWPAGTMRLISPIS